MGKLDTQLARIDRAQTLEDIKEVLRDHTEADADNHKETKEELEKILTILKPISEAFSNASGFKKGVMVLTAIVSTFLGIFWLSIQIYLKLKIK